MLIETITTDQETLIANALKEIYFLSEIEESYSDESQFLKNVIQLVDISIQMQKKQFDAYPEFAHRIPSTHELAGAFIEKYKTALDKAERFAYTINDRFGHSIDIANVVCPYVLYQFGITDENLSFYIGIGMTIANIICDVLAKKEEKKQEKLSEEQMFAICSSLKRLLINAKLESDNPRECDELQKSISELDKIIEN